MSYRFFKAPYFDPKFPKERLVIEDEDGRLSISEAVLTSTSEKSQVANRFSTVSFSSEELDWAIKVLLALRNEQDREAEGDDSAKVVSINKKRFS